MAPPESDIPSGQGNETTGESQFEMNPAWSEALDLIPKSLHNQIAPVFHKWDQGAQTKISEYQDKYSGFDPFVENGVDPEILANALNLAESLKHDPKGVWEAIGSHYGLTPAEVKEVIEEAQESSSDDVFGPKVSKLEERLDLVSNILLNQRKQEADAKMQAEVDAEFDKALKATQEKYGDLYDEDLLLTIMRGKDITDPMEAMKVVASLKGSGTPATPKAYAPTVMGTGGNVPISTYGNKHPSELSEDDTVEIMTTMLRHANAQKRGH